MRAIHARPLQAIYYAYNVLRCLSRSPRSYVSQLGGRTMLPVIPRINVHMYYEVCPKSNKTGVIKTLFKNIEIYQSDIPSK